MDIGAFFRFPGILITIGVVLLIISIVIIILAIRSDKKADFKINEQLKENENNVSFNDDISVEKEVSEPEITPVEIKENKISELEEIKIPEDNVINEVTDEVENNVTDQVSTIPEVSTNTEEKSVSEDDDIELL